MPDPTPTPADREAAEKCRCAIADRLDNDPTPLESNFWLEIVARHFAAHARAARLEERERCVRAIKTNRTLGGLERAIAITAIRKEPTDAE